MRVEPGGISLEVLVQPRASRTRVLGVHDGRLKIALAAPPVDGEANQALVEFLAGALGVRKADVALLRGETGRRKTVRVSGAGAEAALRLL
ncbi:MAG: YggU family protein [Deltaproteobacteria bacterium]|nr:YggU family protein [Deltaproteobacteria bacterium]